MEWYWWLVYAIAALGALAGAAYLGILWGRKETVQQYRAQLTQRANGLAASARKTPPKADSNPIVCDPPMVTLRDGSRVTVMQWGLRAYQGRLRPAAANDKPEYGVWSYIVHDMYTEAKVDLGVARHFNFTDFAALEAKFTATLVLVLDKGLRRKAIDSMERVHANFDITPDEYDRVIAMLAGVLQRYKVPEEAFPAIVEIANTLKPFIAKAVRVA